MPIPSRRERWAGRLVVAALLAVTPGLVLTAPGVRAAEPHGRGAAWLPAWAMTEAVADVTENADLFDDVSPFWYDAATCDEVGARAGAEDPTVLAALRSKGFAVLPTVTATGLTPAAAIRCLGDDASRRAHVASLVELVVSGTYDGLDIDYEHLALTTNVHQARRVRGVFTQFVTELCGALHALSRRCTITVMPRTGPRFTVWRAKLMPAVYDYTALSGPADEVRVMAYDQHAQSWGPGPIAGLPWVRRIVDYAVSTMPRSEVRLGIPTYGRDFSEGSSVSLTRDAATELAAQRGVTPRWDRQQAEAWFTYRRSGVQHTVWFSSPRAVARRTRLAQRHGLAGSVYWAAGLAHSGTWAAVRGG